VYEAEPNIQYPNPKVKSFLKVISVAALTMTATGFSGLLAANVRAMSAAIQPVRRECHRAAMRNCGSR
jgi:hypothetical protein